MGWVRQAPVLLVLGTTMVTAMAAAAVKQRSSIYTEEKRRHIRRNLERYEWARAQRAAAVRSAQVWLDMPDEDLWRMVPEQALPRSTSVNIHLGCPGCGRATFKHGPKPYRHDWRKRPWKIECPECGEVWPKNDFAAYYESGKGPGWVFDPQRADRSLLFNLGHPDPGDPLHKYGVDDGFGFRTEDGVFFLVGYYTAWGPWQDLKKAVEALGEAYLLTDDPAYAHKAGLILDRLADMYPAYDFMPYGRLGMTFSHGGSNLGKWEGTIWSNWMAQRAVRCYDKVFPGLAAAEGLVPFLHSLQERHGGGGDKSSLAALHRNIRTGLLDEVVRAVLNCNIRGNEGMSQCTMALTAIVMDDPVRTPQLLDWLFQPRRSASVPYGSGEELTGGDLPHILASKVDRDGMGNEAAPGYATFWLDYLKEVAAIIADYDGYDRHDVYRDSRAFREMFLARIRIACLDRHTPQIGDSGRTCGTGRVGWSPALFAEGFRYTRDPRLARAAVLAAADRGSLLRGPVTDPEPETWVEKIKAAAHALPTTSGSRNLAGYGLAVLEHGQGEDGTALWLYYGRNSGHGHADRLNIGLYYRGLNLIPDMGYPEHCTVWPKRLGWTMHTASHTTVLVDRAPQERDWGGRPVAFLGTPGVQFVDVSSPGVYSQCSEYRRQCVLVDAGGGEPYVVDVFRVSGGDEHAFSFHGPEGEPVRECGSLTAQGQGTLAGEDVAFGQFYDGAMSSRYRGSGFMYLYDVERGPAGDRFALDWPVIDTWGARAGRPGTAHLRWTMLGSEGELVLAHGDPPYLRHGKPKQLRYGLVFRRGESLSSEFVSVLEGYVDHRLVERCSRLTVTGADRKGVALRVVLPEGVVDTILLAPDASTEYATEDGIRWQGTFAFLRARKGRMVEARLVRGTLLTAGEFSLRLPHDAYRGAVVDFDREMDEENVVCVDADLPTDGSLIGRSIHIATGGDRNGTYTIRGVRREGERTLVSVGAKSLVQGYRDRTDFSKGYAYTIAVGDRFEIPAVVIVRE